MAKQTEDTKTLELIEAPKRRGRPVTGKAKSSAERMQLLRYRQKRDGVKTLNFSTRELALIFESLQHLHSGIDCVESWKPELVGLIEKLKSAY
ncbi:hypothetical protein [Silvimonas sp.]|uniref:hypothetical protein n=1 Tax=Silvimonas sp. TaxID=2650811 RepID=UPI00284BD898|nr:hypothetical protein [Silvimonas sp.]MDR3426910.1 hypothetical protein [Silvimonas sp.]